VLFRRRLTAKEEIVVLWLVVTAVLALLLPTNAAAHGRGPTVALDDRLVVAVTPPGLRARILDGDRSLELTVDGRQTVTVRGYLGEPMIRFADGAVSANRASPTANADRVVSAGTGWARVAGGRTFAWHDHRLAPPPDPTGHVQRWSVPVMVDGRPAAIAGTFAHVAPPDLVPWVLGAVAGLVGVLAAGRRRPRARPALVLALAAGAAVAALVAIGAFAVRDAPTGGVQWFQLGSGTVVAGVAALVLARTRGRRQANAAGVIGALAAAAMLGSLSIFRHGVVISALPAGLARLACATAVVAGVGAAAISFLSTAPRVAR
jgi:hypothetical protein